MPDHFHVLITVEGEMTIERAVQFIKGGFAFRAGKELGFKRPSGKEVFPKCGFTILNTSPSEGIHRAKSGEARIV